LGLLTIALIVQPFSFLLKLSKVNAFQIAISILTMRIAVLVTSGVSFVLIAQVLLIVLFAMTMNSLLRTSLDSVNVLLDITLMKKMINV
jgi:hypothetical protein